MVNNFFSEHDAHLKFLPLYTFITAESTETYRIVIAYPEIEIHKIKHTGVFCVDKSDLVIYLISKHFTYILIVKCFIYNSICITINIYVTLLRKTSQLKVFALLIMWFTQAISIHLISKRSFLTVSNLVWILEDIL